MQLHPCLGQAIVVMATAAAFLGSGFVGIIFLAAALHCLSSSIFVQGQCLPFGPLGKIFWISLFSGERDGILVWVELFVGGFCLTSVLHQHAFAWVMTSSFCVLLFW